MVGPGGSSEYRKEKLSDALSQLLNRIPTKIQSLPAAPTKRSTKRAVEEAQHILKLHTGFQAEVKKATALEGVSKRFPQNGASTRYSN